jgi:hypothetical protein
MTTLQQIDIKQLAQHWVHSREEETQGSDVQIYRRENYKEFPPSRFRMQYIFSADGKCKWYYLAPNDAHHFRDGTWKIDANAENIIHIEQDKTVSYQIVELTEEVLRMVLTTTKTKVFEVQDIGISAEPPSLTASGTVNTAGWKNAELIKRPSSSPGKLEFDFVAQPPDGPVSQVITPIEAVYRLSQEEQNNNHFIVYASQNEKGIFLE